MYSALVLYRFIIDYAEVCVCLFGMVQEADGDWHEYVCVCVCTHVCGNDHKI